MENNIHYYKNYFPDGSFIEIKVDLSSDIVRMSCDTPNKEEIIEENQISYYYWLNVINVDIYNMCSDKQKEFLSKIAKELDL